MTQTAKATTETHTEQQARELAAKRAGESLHDKLIGVESGVQEYLNTLHELAGKVDELAKLNEGLIADSVEWNGHECAACDDGDHAEAMDLLERLARLFNGAMPDGHVVQDLKEFARNQLGWVRA